MSVEKQSFTKVKKINFSHYYDESKKTDFSNELFDALHECGFVILTNHGVGVEKLQAAFHQCEKLFDLSLEEKKQYQYEKGGQRGYTDFGLERAKDNQFSDLKEFWHIGPELAKGSQYHEQYPHNLWPTELPEFKGVFIELFSQLEKVANDLLMALSVGLKIDPDYFSGLVYEGNSVLRLIHYPPVENLDTKNHMRAAAHSDINLLTLLVCASDAGLQLLDRHGEWCDIETEKNEIIVDTGDMMALLTGKKLPSTVHRVINPDDGSKSRYSIPFFMHPHSNAELSCLPHLREANKSDYETITAGEFLEKRLCENGVL